MSPAWVVCRSEGRARYMCAGWVLTVTACTKPVPDDPPAAAAPVTDAAISRQASETDAANSNAAVLGAPTAVVERQRKDATPPTTEEAPMVETPVEFTGPLAMTGVDGGALVVWARPAAVAAKSEILGTVLDAEGAPRGTPTLLRTTSGDVISIAVHQRGGAAWVAWLSQLDASSSRMLVAAMRVASDLSSASTPVSIGQLVADDAGASDLVRVLALANGGAAVASPWSSTRCEDIETKERTECAGYALHWVSDDGSARRAAHFGADGEGGGMGSLVDVGTGVLVEAFAWHGGPTFGHTFARYGEEAEPSPFTLVPCRPPIERAWTGAELVTLCPGDYAHDRERCPLSEDEGLCARVHAVRLDGREVTSYPSRPEHAPPQTSSETRCNDGRPVLEIGWRGGKLVIDPQQPGASTEALDLGTWTGKVVLRADDRGTIVRQRCTRSGALVTDEEPAPAIATVHANHPRAG